MSKLPRTHYVPDLNYNPESEEFTRRELNEHDYPDENGMYPSLNELKSRAAAARRQAEEIDYSVPDICPFCRDGNHCSCGQLEEYNDHNYDPRDDSCEYCPYCGTHGPSEGYYISANQMICRCSPLYPDLRPSDYHNSSLCSCNNVKYVCISETICWCTSPELYTLLERQHELQLTLNLRLILPNKSLEDSIPW